MISHLNRLRIRPESRLDRQQGPVHHALPEYFVYITHHGTYIDGFAGPQQECETHSWAAKLVLESKPRWIRHIHLCDANRTQIQRLSTLRAAQPEIDDKGRKINRTIQIYHNDFNQAIDEILGAGEISENEATFCLLDQRTFECDWLTVDKLSRYKKSGNRSSSSTFCKRLARARPLWAEGYG